MMVLVGSQLRRWPGGERPDLGMMVVMSDNGWSGDDGKASDSQWS